MKTTKGYNIVLGNELEFELSSVYTKGMILRYIENRLFLGLGDVKLIEGPNLVLHNESISLLRGIDSKHYSRYSKDLFITQGLLTIKEFNDLPSKLKRKHVLDANSTLANKLKLFMCKDDLDNILTEDSHIITFVETIDVDELREYAMIANMDYTDTINEALIDMLCYIEFKFKGKVETLEKIKEALSL